MPSHKSPIVRTAKLIHKILVSVTQTDITEGKRNCRDTCMFALAVERALRAAGFDPSYIIVDTQFVRFTLIQNGLRYFYPVPNKLYQAIVAFDAGKRVTPFSVTLYAEDGAFARKSGWKAGHPNSNRAGRTYRHTGKAPRYAVTKCRVFGRCSLVENHAA